MALMERLFDGWNHVLHYSVNIFLFYLSFLLDAPISLVKFKVRNIQTEGFTAETNGWVCQ